MLDRTFRTGAVPHFNLILAPVHRQEYPNSVVPIAEKLTAAFRSAMLGSPRLLGGAAPHREDKCECRYAELEQEKRDHERRERALDDRTREPTEPRAPQPCGNEE